MREIKFRGWDKERSEITYPKEYSDMAWFLEDHKPKAGFILMQYTGLKDKNGTEIYEGDILLNTNPKFETGVPFVTEWGDKHNYSGWMFRRKGQVVGNLFIYRNLKNCEIIGNIHENGDLLEPPHEEPLTK